MRKLVFTLMALVWALTPINADGKSYTVPELLVQVQARPDGTMEVVEELTYRFNGSFSFAFRDIPLKPGEALSNVHVREGEQAYTETAGQRPGTFQVEQSGRNLRVTWYYRAEDETRTFELAYDVTGVIKRYRDVGVLYFKFIGEDWDRPIGNVSVQVRGPERVSSSDVRAWAHGPLHGTVEIQSDGVVRLDVRPLPARTFWEGRILYPSSAFDGLPVQDQEMRELIVQEEARWAEAANQRREAHLREMEERVKQRQQQEMYANRLGPVAWFVGLAGLAMWFAIFRRHGKPHDVKSRIAPGDIPSDHPPAIISYLMFSRNVGASAIVATLLDLANRGYLEIEETTREEKRWFGGTRKKVDYRFFLGQKPIGELEGFEKALLDFLLNEAGTGTEFSLTGVKKTARKKRRKFRKWFMEWIKAVKAHGATLGFYEPIAVGPVLLNTLVGIAIFAGGAVLSAGTDSPAGVPAMVMGGLQALLSLALRRHTVDGRRLAIAWREFQAHLKRTAKARGPVALSSSEWSRYLAAAILFGMHKKLLPQIKMVDDSGHAAYPVWYHAVMGSSSGDFSALADGFTSMVTTMSSTMSSASGTGGGASGGGGGGSGGGGGGAG